MPKSESGGEKKGRASELVFGGLFSFLLGVFIASSYGLATWISLAVFSYWLWSKAVKDRNFHYALIFVLALSLGFFYYHFYLNLKESRENIVLNQKLEFIGVVSSEPKARENSQELIVSLKPPLGGQIKIIVSRFPEFHYGDLLQADHEILPASRPDDLPTVLFPKITLLESDKGFWLKAKLLKLKGNLISRFRELLGQDQSALLSGLTLGSRGDFRKEFRDEMARSGTTHLVALSGYNIAILVLALGKTFGRYLSRRKTFYLTALIILFFVMMTGAEASVVRAAIMGFLILLAKEAGRFYNFHNALLLAAFAMVLVNPLILRYDIGFQLSFLSLLGIVYIAPILKNLMKLEEGKGMGFLNWKESAATTFSAQLAVAPLLIKTFGQFSLTALGANILILGLVPLTMFLGFVLAGLSLISTSLGFLLAKLTSLLLSYEIGVIKIFASLSLPIAGISSGLFIIYYLFLLIFILYFQKPSNDLSEERK